jgi:diguanylate cyclase (GGDEF)-like protein
VTAAGVLLGAILIQQGLFGLLWSGMAWMRLSRRAALHWGASALLFAATTFLLGERGDWPTWATWWLPYLLLVLGAVGLRRGVEVFLRQSPRDFDGSLVLVVAVVGLAVGTGLQDQSVMSFVAASVMGYLLMTTALLIVRRFSGEFGRAAALICAAFPCIAGAAMLVRAVHVMLWPDTGNAMVNGNEMITLVLGFIFLVCGMLLHFSIGALVMLRLVRRVQFQANHDALTSLLNRRGFLEQLELERARMARHGGHFALMALDIDHFKRINDQHGHGTGDEVLRRVSAVLQAQARRVDRIGRVGGEEFWVLMPETTAEAATGAAKRMLEALRGEIHHDIADGFRVTASAGVGDCADASEPVERLMRRVDKALYAAKDAGRDCLKLAQSSGRTAGEADEPPVAPLSPSAAKR